MIAYSLYQYDTTKAAQFRLKVIDFHNEFGTKATIKAFGVKRSTIFLWKKKLRDSGGQLSSLIPNSTRPRRPGRTRRMMVDKRIIRFIKELREKHHCLGKEKIKPKLDNFCKENSLQTISSSTIGRILKRNNCF